MTHRRQNFMGGAAILAGAVAVTKLLGALYKIPLGNLLDREGMAHFYAAYNIYSLLLVLSTAGLPVALSRMVSRAAAQRRYGAVRRCLHLGLALLAALRPGTETRFTGAARLRDKESDRLASVSAALTALGGRVRQEPEGLTVWGTDRLTGGEAHSCGDHRIAMLCACAAPFCTGPVLLRDAGCTDKAGVGLRFS